MPSSPHIAFDENGVHVEWCSVLNAVTTAAQAAECITEENKISTQVAVIAD